MISRQATRGENSDRSVGRQFDQLDSEHDEEKKSFEATFDESDERTQRMNHGTYACCFVVEGR